jgi:hypothetical protein
MTGNGVILYMIASVALATSLVAIGLLGLATPLSHLLEPGTLICRRLLSSRYDVEMEGNMIGDVLIINMAIYTVLILFTFVSVQAHSQRKETRRCLP